MEMTFRWYGEDDPVTLKNIRQIPTVRGIISAVYDIPVGEVWPVENIQRIKDMVEQHGLRLSGIESVPVHEDIKMGKDSRDKLIENYKQTLRNIAECGIDMVCYNFMRVFVWTRTDLAYELYDGSNALIFDECVARRMDPLNGDLSLPGWDSSYTKEETADIIKNYSEIDNEKLWKNLEYFIKKIIPVAEEVGIKMAIHPDDPPYSIFGLPRIITGKEAIARFLDIYDSPNNGLALCVGSYASNPTNDVNDILRYALERNRVNFMHTRNILLKEGKSFEESAHPTEYGSIDMYKVIKALSDYDWNGPIRPDHGRMIWGETGRPGYGLYDRALGATYLSGLWEAIRNMENKDLLQKKFGKET